MTRLAILGFGLIGGSVALALAERAPRSWRVSAWSPSGRGPAAAGAAGLIAVAARDPSAAMAGADLVLLAADPRANLELVGRVGPSIAAAGAVLSDVTSVQQPMAAAAAAVTGLRAVGGHPMSGRERAGYQAASATLFVDRPWVVLPGPLASLDDVALVERLATDCGARPLRLDPAAHDAAVALISQLPLVMAASLVETAAGAAAWPHARELAAQGWRDTTRLARGDPALGAGMLSLNAGAVAAALRSQRATLDAWQARLDQLASEQPGDTATVDVDSLLAALEDIAELASSGTDRA
jgi:prephenate dehydrogenase